MIPQLVDARARIAALELTVARLEAQYEILYAHSENLIERVYALEGGDE